MPRAARLVIPGVPHHVIQRGNRRQTLFFDDSDRRAFVDLLADACARHQTACLAWCLMDNHVHSILVPADPDGLRAPLASVHTAYSQRINRRFELTGHLFQGRFASYAMDERHLMVAARYVENNPVKAGLVARAEDWRWSSARAHIDGRADRLTDIEELGRHVPNWRAMLALGLEAGGHPPDEAERIERALASGRPIGSDDWLAAFGHTPSPRGTPGRPRRTPAVPAKGNQGQSPIFRMGDCP